jgi:hypothetical protein
MKTFKLPKRPLLAALFLLPPPKLHSPEEAPFGVIFGKIFIFSQFWFMIRSIVCLGAGPSLTRIPCAA